MIVYVVVELTLSSPPDPAALRVRAVSGGPGGGKPDGVEHHPVRGDVGQQHRVPRDGAVEELPVDDAAAGGLGVVVPRADDPLPLPDGGGLVAEQADQGFLVGGDLR